MPRPKFVLTRKQKDDLRRLAALVERDGPLPEEGVLYRAHTGLGGSLVFRGEALRLYRRLVLELSRPALSDGGPLPEVVEGLVTQFVTRATAGKEDESLEWLKAELSAPVTAWTFIEPLNAYPPHTPFKVGFCTVASDLSELDHDPSEFAPAKMTGPFIATTVEARGQATARLVSVERIAEATALLALLSGPSEVEDGQHFVVQGDGRVGWSTGNHAGLNVYRVSSGGKLWPGYRELSDALVRPEDQRSDLEKRVAGAARWWRKASTTSWPSEMLVTGMSALECLLLLSGERDAKRDLVAARASEIAVLETMTKTAQVGWLKKLYDRRNHALHAGRFHQDDLDAINFLALVDLVVHRSVQHLHAWHTGTNAGPCTTVEQFLTCREDD